MTTLHFVRHGHSEANVAHVFANRGSGYPLTAVGLDEARSLAARFAGVTVDRILTRPLLRARRTADVVAAVTGAAVEVSDALRECEMGDLEGRSDPAAWGDHASVNEDWLRSGDLDRRPPGGENLREVLGRFTPLIDALRTEPAGQRFVLVGHGSLYRAVLPLVLAGVDPSFTLEDLGHSETVVAEQRGEAFVSVESASNLPFGRLVGRDDHAGGRRHHAVQGQVGEYGRLRSSSVPFSPGRSTGRPGCCCRVLTLYTNGIGPDRHRTRTQGSVPSTMTDSR